MGFDKTGKFLLTVSHSGRGVYATETWERIARNQELAFPKNGLAEGIGPLEGQVIAVDHRDQNKERIEMDSPDGLYKLLGESDGITITKITKSEGNPSP